ncbi:MAG: MBL fold metallo-hydrolase [Bacteroidota bacterium]
MKLTILYDNTVFNPALEADWGFSCFIETGDRNILFDTGTKGRMLIKNMKKLGIKPSMVDDVFISHNHFDHTGGLSEFLHQNNNVNIYLPPSLRGVHGAKEIIFAEKPGQLHDNVYTTGELDGIEQSLVVSTTKGLVLIVGCSHPEMRHIFDAASRFGEIYAIIGGLHGFNEFGMFDKLKLICPTHCTRHIAELKKLYPDKYTEGGAGKTIEI